MVDVPVGQLWLVENLYLRVPAPAVTSYCGPGARRTTTGNGRTIEKYSNPYAPEDTIAGHLKFALKNEPIDSAIMAAAMRAIDPGVIEQMVRAEPTGAFSRRAWFLYEFFTGKTLNLTDAPVVQYTKALNPELNVGSVGINSVRHRVTNNMLGVPGFCVTVRLSSAIKRYQAEGIDEQVLELVQDCDATVLARAVNFLYTKETKSSYEIEHERATGQKAERFVKALRQTASFNPSSDQDLVDLQNKIVDPRYAAKGFRDFQNFVGETIGYREKVHFVCPRPEDLPSMMKDWASMSERLKGCDDAVAAAAAISFSFVFLHPFEDGNGRIHRFLIHHVLSREGFTPDDILFPISAAIVRNQKSYDAALESVSGPTMGLIEWEMNRAQQVVVTNDTSTLYRYFDATELVEYLYEKISETIRIDFKEELDFVSIYDTAYNAVRDVIDMPDRRASMFVNFYLQNNGSISKRKREMFEELTDDDIKDLEAAIRDALNPEAAADEDDKVPEPGL
ncbi:Fic family protein [Rhizobium tubonense]|uniref:Cell filamentation protein Fic n=1 Tax=Rhizobium tubonense TaxID=484088 RepID=A0A2W4CAF5_9HYPH|nr:Fic family protein [Rhizobium tubonense]PZM08338.1 cell filamentation protein Fic [Rhizobium tubonense]